MYGRPMSSSACSWVMGFHCGWPSDRRFSVEAVAFEPDKSTRTGEGYRSGIFNSQLTKSNVSA